MLAVTRHQKIMELLDEQGAVKVSELSAMFQVTEKTIREDLEKLDEKGLLTRIHGGAVRLDNGEENVYPPVYPNCRLLQDKVAIAERALSFIESGDIIALDSGSTTLEMARRLPDEPLTVVTNDLMIIRELALKERIRLVIPGGYRHQNMLVNQEAPDWVRQLNIHKLFLSTTGIHTEYGLTIFTSEHVEMKKALMDGSRKIYCVADHSKFDKGALLTFASLEQVDTIITDAKLDPATAGKYEALGVQVVRASSTL